MGLKKQLALGSSTIDKDSSFYQPYNMRYNELSEYSRVAHLNPMKQPSQTLNRLLALLLLFSLFSTSSSPVIADTGTDTGPSILHPSQSVNREYRFPIDAIDPTPSSNPRGANSPGYRGENQMVVYTPHFGASTGTNDAGTEAVVSHGMITQTGNADATIPADGFVISGHGSAALWLSKFGRPGAQVTLDETQQELVIRLTPSVYLYEVDQALQRAQSRPPANPDAYQKYLTQAQSCRAQLADLQDQPLSADLLAVADQCRTTANRAYYNTLESRPQEFRGAWIRPASIQPEQIAKVVQSLKKNHVGNVFLETYFQGETAYPSQVMKEYGLPEQHPQYHGGDPIQLWVEAAHKEGIKVHLWTQVFFAGNSRENAELYGPILHTYPQWRNVQRPNWNAKNPVISDIEPGHYFLDPANPEVRTFLKKLLLEMVSRYDIDGLNLDYIRYPASAAVTKSIYLETTWGYTESARQQFQAMIAQERGAAEAQRLAALKKAGKHIAASQVDPKYPSADPKNLTLSSPLWPRWVAWRKAQVSSFVKEVSTSARAIKPNLLISAVVFPSHEPTYAQKLQDYARWTSEGDVQALTPIGLSTNPERMLQQCKLLKEQVQGKAPIYIGIFGLYNRTSPVELVQQIDTAHQADMPGVVLFDWSRLTPPDEDALLEGPFRN